MVSTLCYFFKVENADLFWSLIFSVNISLRETIIHFLNFVAEYLHEDMQTYSQLGGGANILDCFPFPDVGL